MKTYRLMKLFFFTLLIFLTGCKDDDIWVNTDIEGDNRQLEVAAPAGEITYQIADFLDDLDNEYVFVDEDGLVYARYSQQVDIEWESLVTLNDFQETWYFSPLDFILAPGLKAAAAGNFIEKVKLNTSDDVRYDTIYMDGGILEATLTVPNGISGDIKVSIPEVLSNGQPLEYSFDPGETNPFYISENLSGMKVLPSQGQDSSYISVDVTYNLENPELGDVELYFSLTDMTPGLTFGYFGQQTSTKLEQELAFDVFEELDLADEIEFRDFRINLEVTSGIGVPFDVRTENMQFYLEDGSPCDMLTVDGNTYVDLFIEPAIYGNPIENSVTTFNISRENSANIVDIGNCYPSRMVFDVTSSSNPDGETSVLNFMGPDNILRGNMNVILPAWFKTSDYSRKDTVDFDIHDIVGEDEEDVREIEGFTVWFDFYSKIPVDIIAHAWVIDAQGNKIGDLLDGDTNVIVAGEPDEQTGYVQEPAHSEFSVTVSGDQIDDYLDRNAMNIVLQTGFSTPEGSEYIKIYEDMDFRAVVSFEGGGKIPSF